MSDLLDSLGVTGDTLRWVVAAAIWLSFGSAMVAIAAAQALFEKAVGASTLLVAGIVVLVWIAWTGWHSHIFAVHRKAYLAAGIPYPYRRAFVRDIFPGITVGFSQMLRPALNGVNLETGRLLPHLAESSAGRAMQLVGLVVFLGAFVLFACAWGVLGAAKVGFAAEFGDTTRFEPVRRGPYGHVRHPLFWSGIGVSWSLALIWTTRTGLIIAAINSAYGLAYNVLEDRRLALVLGERYQVYSKEVPHIVPLRFGRKSAH